MKATPEQMAKLEELKNELAFYAKEIQSAIDAGDTVSAEWFRYVTKGVQSDIKGIIEGTLAPAGERSFESRG